MEENVKPLILSVDDDPDVRQMLKMTLEAEGYRVAVAPDGHSALQAAAAVRPNLILLDYMMPGMSGIDVCARLQDNPATNNIPVVFLTAVSGEMERSRAFALGAVDYLVKPVTRDALLQSVATHLATAGAFQAFDQPEMRSTWSDRVLPSAFAEFRTFLADRFSLGPESAAALAAMMPATVLSAGQRLGITPGKMAEAIGVFLDIGLVTQISSREVRLGILPTPFSKSNLVVPIRNYLVGDAFVVCNPFNWELLDTLERATDDDETFSLLVAEPETILAVFETALEQVRRRIEVDPAENRSAIDPVEAERKQVVAVADNILASAIRGHAQDIMFDPGQTRSDIHIRVDGEMIDLLSVSPERSQMLVSRFKALAGMDISEKRRPQRGSIEVGYGREDFDLILSTTPTSYGESLAARMIPVGRPPRKLVELGMTPEQAAKAEALMQRPRGLVLLVGPGASGKSVTAHSLISGLTDASTSILTAEDPIENRIAFANQQQVDVRAGVTFEALIRSAERRNPDILFVGEIRDAGVARLVTDFARTRRLVVATMQAPDALGALERLDEWGISRTEVAEAIICVIAQRLVRTPCPSCRVTEPPTAEETATLAEYIERVPEQVAHAAGCPQCSGSGFHGRTGIFEIVPMSEVLSGMLRTGVPIADLRSVQREREGCTLCDVALKRVVDLTLTPGEVYKKVLVEAGDSAKLRKLQPREPSDSTGVAGERVLIVDDTEDTRDLLATLLGRDGIEVELATNGVEALRMMSVHEYDLVLSDLNMPLMGGFDLFERAAAGHNSPPAILYSASENDNDEIKSLQLGAVDYIRIPVNPEILRLRVFNALRREM